MGILTLATSTKSETHITPGTFCVVSERRCTSVVEFVTEMTTLRPFRCEDMFHFSNV